MDRSHPYCYLQVISLSRGELESVIVVSIDDSSALRTTRWYATLHWFVQIRSERESVCTTILSTPSLSNGIYEKRE